MILRDYQTAAVNATWDYISHSTGNPCVVLPTGAGKSLVLAKLAHEAAMNWGGRVILLAHVKELLEQNAEKLRAIAPDLDVGVYSAGLGKRDRRCQVLVAGIQSVYQRACDFDPFDLIIIDEAHLLPPDGDGMYRTFLDDCRTMQPHVRLIGLTATPYRMQTGWLCGPENLLNDICYEAGVKELILAGWLSRLISKEGLKCDTSALHVRGGEFVADEAEKLMLDVVGPACGEIVSRTASRQSVLVFCQSINHAVEVFRTLSKTGSCRLVTGDTPSGERATILSRFKSRDLKYLVNVNVLTTGFDAPNVDCVCLLRPTLSPGLYYQMVGRGFRTCDGKQDCLVLDFAGNVRRHGPVDQIQPKPTKINGANGEAPTKTCPSCQTVCHAAYSECPDCGHEFEDRGRPKHDAHADAVPVTSLEVVRTEWPVIDVKYAVHTKRNAEPGTPRTLRVEYKINPIRWVSEWVCVEHDGYALTKAKMWWRARSNDRFPLDAERAVDVANGGGVALATHVTVEEKAGEKFPRIVAVKLGPKPEAVDVGEGDENEFEFPVGEVETFRDPLETLSW